MAFRLFDLEVVEVLTQFQTCVKLKSSKKKKRLLVDCLCLAEISIVRSDAGQGEEVQYNLLVLVAGCVVGAW
jgi:uncharacterized membrane protein YqgA involved in biofilm formation